MTLSDKMHSRYNKVIDKTTYYYPKGDVKQFIKDMLVWIETCPDDRTFREYLKDEAGDDLIEYNKD